LIIGSLYPLQAESSLKIILNYMTGNMCIILFKEEEEKVKAEVIRGTNRKCILT